MLLEEELKSIDELIMLKHFLETEEKYEGQEREVNAIKIVLNLINKLQKENEKERNKNKQLSNSIIKIYKEQDNLQARLDRKRDEIRKKDKQIDLMAEYMFNKNKAQLIIEYGIENKEQFIEKFEKLAKEKGE